MEEKIKLRDWFEYGVAIYATHMLVIGDLKNFTSHPTYVFENQSILDKLNFYENHPYLVVLEMYLYSEPFEDQLEEKGL